MTTTLRIIISNLIAVLLITLPGNGAVRTPLYNSIAYARCELICQKNTSTNNNCVPSCLDDEWKKPGTCPSHPSGFASVCLDECQEDVQCFGMQKCCRHRCGATCQTAEDLQRTSGLPAIPTDVKVSEGNKRRTIIIKWHSSKPLTPILYLLEERHHTGANYLENKLGEWSNCGKTSRPMQIIKNYAKPGRWYQFRVAAINENGTRGFSEVSNIYKPTFNPRPPEAPQNVTVRIVARKNNTVDVEIKWKAPHSDLPVQKYKIFCSRRLHGAKPLDSVHVDQQVVSKENTKTIVKNLQANSSYFVQVQAIVQFGRKRLKGEMSGFAFNTTAMFAKNATEKASLHNLKLVKIFLGRDGDLKARISWKAGKKVPKYSISWTEGSCKSSSNKFDIIQMWEVAKKPQFDVYKLRYGCNVDVFVGEMIDDYLPREEQMQRFKFETPSCQEFKRNFNKRAKCPGF